MEENRTSGRLIGAAIEVHKTLGPGLLESTYQRCLAHELRLRGIAFEQEVAVGVNYKGLEIDGAYRADFIVSNSLVVELKSTDRIEPVHKAQLLTYLKWSRLNVGLLINFNVRVLKSGICRIVNSK
jgi:GxxExxY protein